MSARELIGFVALIIGVALTAVGWIVNHKVLLVSAAFIFIGAWLFYTERMRKRDNENSQEHPGHVECAPGDINNSTGSRTGGRTNPLDPGGCDGGFDDD